MSSGPVRLPRAAGRRLRFDDLPNAVRAAIEARIGPVEVAHEHRGGMSPGCATTVQDGSGRELFIKAVGTDLNVGTTALFRTEAQILARLTSVDYRPALVETLDDGDWIALILEHVEGRHPDLADPSDRDAVAALVSRQAVELSPPPPGIVVPTLAEQAQRWSKRWELMAPDPARFLPAWAAGTYDSLLHRVRGLCDVRATTTLCHFDVRDDNLLIRPDGRAVIVDWGMARIGPSWTDSLLLAMQSPDPASAQKLLQEWIPAEAEHVVTDVLLAFGGSQAWNAAQDPDPSLPAMPAFCADDAARLLGLARLRLR